MTNENRVVKFEDWMSEGSDAEEPAGFPSHDRFEGGIDGHMRLQLEKTFGGDERFKLTKDFDVSLKDANAGKRHISEVMMGGLSKKEQKDFFEKKNEHSDQESQDIEVGEIDIEKEKNRALSILAQIVPASEIFLTSSKA